MKIPTLVILVLALTLVNSVRPPSPLCRTSPLPAAIPISIGETVKFDLEDIFTGFNLQFDGKQNDHISMTPKYTMNSSEFNRSMAFRSVKISHNGRFLGLISNDSVTELAIGYNYPDSGVDISTVIDIEDHPGLHCFDVEQVNAPIANKTYAMIDCGEFKDGVLDRNVFMFVDLQTKKLFLGSKETDVFVNYNHLSARQTHQVTDPRTRLSYLFRIILAKDVDQDHQNQTYVQIFMLGDHPVQAQILDVIDHTFLDLPSLTILDYQMHFNNLYLLVKDKGIYQLSFSPSQRILLTGFLQVKLNAQQFRVEQLGFNDQLHVAVANDNTIYQYEWDTASPPVLVDKYSLLAGSVVEELLIDAEFVIVQATTIIDDEYHKKIWVFSRMTHSYTHAFGAFDYPVNESTIIVYEGDGNTLHLVQQKSSSNIKLNLPDLKIYPVTERASETEDYVIIAKSTTHNESMQCRQTIKFIYIDKMNASIIRTDLEGLTTRVVDSPDESEVMLDYEFFGPFINYNVTFNVENSSIFPRFYINKQHKATVNFPFQIPQQNITYLEMFEVRGSDDLAGKVLHGIVEYKKQDKDTNFSYPIAYIKCEINVDDYDEQHTFKCFTLQTIYPYSGRVLIVSQVLSFEERFMAFVFQDNDRQFQIYYYSSKQLTHYCSKNFTHQIVNNLNDIEINENKMVLATFQIGKRIQIYSLEDLKHAYDYQIPCQPLFTIDSRVMAFFGVEYFAPVDMKLSPYHRQVAFVRTKNGVMAININKRGMPELLFHIKTSTARYDFEVTRDSLLIITGYNFQLYRLETPLTRLQQPFLLQKYDGNFTLESYGEMDAEGFFYLVQSGRKGVLVLHPNMPSTSIFYSEIPFDHVSNLDSTRMGYREYLFVQTDKTVEAWVLAEHPTLRTYWHPSQNNFTMNVSGYNAKTESSPYTFNYSVLQSVQTDIKATDKFNLDEIRKAGHVKVDMNAPRIDKNITLNDTDWFNGTITHFTIDCKHCNKNVTPDKFQVQIQNHISETPVHIHAGQPVYDMKPTFEGVYGQQYNAFFKTFRHNNSIQYTAQIPTGGYGEVCTKMFVPVHHQFMMSFCETGQQVNAYITSLTASKPFTIGPIRTQAKAVNKVKLEGDILIIVDNEDNPYTRSGGVYIYLFNYMANQPQEMLIMLDYLDYEDFQMQGFTGFPFIASADIHKPLFNKEEYTLFITQSRTGSIFAFTLQVSDNRQEAVYLGRKLLSLKQLIPSSVRYPLPLRIQSVQILDYTIRTAAKRLQIDYVLLITVLNWHHIQIEFTVDEEIDVLSFQLVRVFERVPYPWKLTNYIALRNGNMNTSYFAVSYLQIENHYQMVAIYQLPRFNHNTTTSEVSQLKDSTIPITKLMGAYLVRDDNQITFSFRIQEESRMLLNDVGDQHIKDIEINKEIKIKVLNLDPTKQDPENVTVSARNYYTSYNFSIQLTWEDQDEELKREILWIVITVIGVIMIIGLIIIWCRQSKKEKVDDEEDPNKGTTKQSLLTVENQFKSTYINRSSVDPESERATVDFSTKPSPYSEQPKQMIKEEEQIDENDPLEQRIKEGDAGEQEELVEEKQKKEEARNLIEAPEVKP